MQLPEPSRKARTGVVLAITLAVAVGVAIALTELFGEILESVADNDGIAAWDRPVLDWAISARTPGFTTAVAWYSNTGGPLWQPIVTGLVVVFLCWRWRDLTPLVLTVIAVGGSLLITVLGKRIIGRARPLVSEAVAPFEESMSFPSGHSLNALVIAGILAYLLGRHFWEHQRWATWLAVALAALYALSMGLSRVFLGHHWLTDVLGAWAIGLAWLAVVIVCHRVWRTVRHPRDRVP